MSIYESTAKISPFSYKDMVKKGLNKEIAKEIPKTSIVRLACNTIGNNSNQRSRSSSRENAQKISDEMIISGHNSTDSSDTSSSTIKTSTNSSESELGTESSKFESSDTDSPVLSYGPDGMEMYNLEKDLYKESSKKKKHIDEADFLNPNWKLPGGKKYQKDGVRLENAFYNGLPKKIKNNISVNVKPRYPNGNVIVEFDMIYQSESSKRIISFEIKGVNPNTINNLERQRKLISQGIRQKKYLEENFSGYKVDCVYCFVTGKIKTSEIVERPEIVEQLETPSEWKSVRIVRTKPTVRAKPILDADFINKIKLNGIGVAIGETPQQCAKNALLALNLLR